MEPIKTRVALHSGQPTVAQVDRCPDWIVVCPAGIEAARRAFMPCLNILLRRRHRLRKGDTDNEPIITDLPNPIGSQVAFALVKPDISEFDLLTLARKLAGAAFRNKAGEIGIAVSGFNARQRERIAEAQLAAVLAAGASMPDFKSEKDPAPPIKRVDIFGVKAAHGFGRTRAEAEGNAIARYLSLLPANRLAPADYLRIIRVLARKRGWRLQFHDVRALARIKAGAFLAVASGSPSADAGIVHLRYQPPGMRSGAKPGVSLVGKGVCFDTGGVNLKTAKFMYNMHQDMQGSAVALGTLLALAQLKYRQPVDAWLALVMNHIGPKAYKPNDVVTACDGTSIEVVDTDAEGRMILADTLALASKTQPEIIIDFATLTGACVHSLGRAYSGVFTNRDELVPKLIAAGRASGERVWPFPMDADYDEALRSDIADVKQCSTESGADHILAARFLQRFVKNNVPWIHIDLSASRSKGGLAHVPTDTTGFGVRYALSLLLEGGILEFAQRASKPPARRK